jgi:hypothetical protein
MSDPSPSTLTAPELDACYTQLCHTMTQVGEAATPLFLARFALLAMGQIGDAEVIETLVHAAARDCSLIQ